jgi:hypothetical protein
LRHASNAFQAIVRVWVYGREFGRNVIYINEDSRAPHPFARSWLLVFSFERKGVRRLFARRLFANLDRFFLTYRIILSCFSNYSGHRCVSVLVARADCTRPPFGPERISRRRRHAQIHALNLNRGSQPKPLAFHGKLGQRSRIPRHCDK